MSEKDYVTRTEFFEHLNRYVSKSMLWNTLICTAGMAILLTWGLSRFDVWRIEAAIKSIAKQVNMHNSNTVNVNGEDQTRTALTREVLRAKGHLPLEVSDADMLGTEEQLPDQSR